MENQICMKIKSLRADNGLEFCNQKFDQLCKEAGIRRHKTWLYTPQQNGISERMNMTTIEKVTSMLTETGLDGSNWAEAASIAVYVINRSPSASIKFEIPEERWSGHKPGYGHMRCFRCIVYVHQVIEKTSPREARGIFLGYAEGTRGYIIWLLEEQKVSVSKDVVFNEEKLFKDLEKEQVSVEERSESKVTNKRVNFRSVLEDICEGESSNSGGASVEALVQDQNTT